MNRALPRITHRRRLLFSTLVGVALAACGGGNELVTPTTVTTPTTTVPAATDAAALAAARSRWAAASLDTYRITFEDDCGECDPTPPGEAVVWDDELLRDNGWAMSVDEVFASIEGALAKGTRVDVTYHPDLGYPTDVWIDPEARAYDGGIHWKLSNLQPGLPGNPASLNELLAARDRWEANAPSAYEYVVKFLCDCDFAGSMWTQVQGDRVIDWEAQLRNPDEDTGPLTIDTLLDDLEDLFQAGAIEESGVRFTGSAQYDPVLGYPTWIGINIEILQPDFENVGFPPRIVFVIDQFDASPPTLLDLTAARQTWEAAGWENYRFEMTVHVDNGKPVRDQYVTTILFGDLYSVDLNGVTTDNPYHPVWPIPELFDQMEMWRQVGFDVEATIDDRGHPTEISVSDGLLVFHATLENLEPVDPAEVLR